MAPQTRSNYLYYPWLVAFLVFFGAALLFAAISACVLLCAPPKRAVAIAVTVLLTVAVLSLNFAFAFTAAFLAFCAAAANKSNARQPSIRRGQVSLLPWSTLL